jgi:aspartyl-tRNA(Asn)/glutamyl-tRNA(Gln) amidotransferase subunit A
LYSGADYVQAQRERRLMLAEMAPIYDKYDLLMTLTAPGPAPRFGTWRTVSFWQNSSLTTPFNVTAGPALAQCMGFTLAGLPLSLQLVGRPFDEATVLRAADAYEKATNWRKRRPNLDPAAAFSTEPPPAIQPEPADDPAVRDLVLAACRRAELSLNDSQIDMICSAAPYVMAMTRRLRRDRDFREEPANIFRFSG